MPLWRKYEEYRENYPNVKCLANVFAKFSPSENNHVYSISLYRIVYPSVPDDIFKFCVIPFASHGVVAPQQIKSFIPITLLLKHCWVWYNEEKKSKPNEDLKLWRRDFCNLAIFSNDFEIFSGPFLIILHGFWLAISKLMGLWHHLWLPNHWIFLFCYSYRMSEYNVHGWHCFALFPRMTVTTMDHPHFTEAEDAAGEDEEGVAGDAGTSDGYVKTFLFLLVICLFLKCIFTLSVFSASMNIEKNLTSILLWNYSCDVWAGGSSGCSEYRPVVY